MLHFPTNLEIDITGRCNYSCSFCRNGHLDVYNDMDFDTIIRLLNECVKHGIFSISISGGEPTMHCRFNEIVSYIGKINIAWALTTNGSNIDDNLAELLSCNGIKSVYITLSGFTNITETKHKNADHVFDKTMQAIQSCKKYQIPIVLGYILTPMNISEINMFIDFCLKNCIRAKLTRVYPMGNALDNNNLFISEETYKILLKEFKDKLGKLALLGENSVPFEKRVCSAGVLSCVVGYDYNVYPCVNFLGDQKVSCGSILDSSLYDIWNSSKVMNAFRTPRVYMPYCQKCSYKDTCNGGCRAEAYKQSGDYCIIEKSCDYVCF